MSDDDCWAVLPSFPDMENVPMPVFFMIRLPAGGAAGGGRGEVTGFCGEAALVDV